MPEIALVFTRSIPISRAISRVSRSVIPVIRAALSKYAPPWTPGKSEYPNIAASGHLVPQSQLPDVALELY